MRQVYRHDEEDYYKEPVLIGDNDPIPADCLEDELPQPNWKCKAVNGKWVETITEEEKPKPIEPGPSVEERLVLTEDALNFILFGGI